MSALLLCLNYGTQSHHLYSIDNCGEARIFVLVDLQTIVIFRKVEKKFKIILFYRPTLNIICFFEKNNIFLRFCLCIFESDTVKTDCPMQENYEILKDLIQTVGLLY